MREITQQSIIEAVRAACIEANCILPEDVRQQFVYGRATECAPLGQEIFDRMIENAQLAQQNHVPICQDTGMVVVFADIGQEVHIKGDIEAAIHTGVRQGYRDGYLRMSVVEDPLRRVNTGDNTPAVIYVRLVPGDELHLTIAPKGFGSENMSALRMFTPSSTREEIIDYIVSVASKAGSNPCPPMIIGVGLGGTFDMAAVLAKRACITPLNAPPEDAFYGQMQQEILQRVNALGIGPQGFGGTVSALGVHICTYPTHIAGLPCAVNIGCHVTRHVEISL